ncbi:segregation/condensation protein A [uncultured Microscilla sp.]|uniref:segregation and condensation protein A n=1 Tax=uncultured Microscilla sp. TaxID=432653 RepID=UPI00261D888A|nr:segregation/condensation protein A [uncultured Microscilla sp.]
MGFEIKLPLFEGPFDLLLFFIERQEIDIYDIPISTITKDFLDYMHQMEQMNIELASEFIVVAATLMRIKAKMLLPRDEENGEDDDPRQELVDFLLEYKKYKSVLKEFEALEDRQLMREKRGNVIVEIEKVAGTYEVDIEMHRLDLYKLLQVYEKAMARYESRIEHVVHKVVPYPYTVAQQKTMLMSLLEQKPKLEFNEIVLSYKTKIAVIFNFLAILELLQNGLVSLHIEPGYNNFWIEKKASEQQVTETISS